MLEANKSISRMRGEAERQAFKRAYKNCIVPKPGDDDYESDDMHEMRNLDYYSRRPETVYQATKNI